MYTFHRTASEYTSSRAHEQSAKYIIMLVQKKTLNKFQKIEIISRSFSDHNKEKKKKEINYKKKAEKFTNV